jgi:hypothetical protein
MPSWLHRLQSSWQFTAPILMTPSSSFATSRHYKLRKKQHSFKFLIWFSIIGNGKNIYINLFIYMHNLFVVQGEGGKVVGTALSQLVNRLATSLLETPCWQVVGTELSQLVNKFTTSLLRRHLVDKLLEQNSHNLLTSLLQACWRDILLTSSWNSIVTTC